MTAAWTAPLKEMHLQTDLTAGAEIVVPSGTEWKPLIAQLREQLRLRAGVELPIVSAEEASLSRLKSHHWVLLGSAVDNPVLAALYRRQCAFVDDFYPGDDGVRESIYGSIDGNVYIYDSLSGEQIES